VEKGKQIGQGRTAKIYALANDELVLKLYHDHIPNQFINQEFEIGKAVYEAGISSPKVYEIVEDNGRKGIIYQHIQGESMLQQLIKKPWKLCIYGKRMAKLHYQIHTCKINDLPKAEDIFVKSIKINKKIASKEVQLLKYFNTLSTGNNVCHGDFHPDNIMISQNEWIVLDWTNGYSGNPLSDVARTYVLIRTPFMPDVSKIMLKLSKLFKYIICTNYIKEYQKLAHVKFKDIYPWFVPIATKRLLENIPGEEKWLLKIINKGLKSKGENI